MSNKVLYITGDYPCLTETFIDNEIVGLRGRGFNIRVVALNSLTIWSLASSAISTTLTLTRFVQLSARLGEVNRKQRITSALRANAIHGIVDEVDHIHAAFLGAPAVVAHILAKYFGKPYSLSAHANDIFCAHTPEAVIREASFCAVCTNAGITALREKYPNGVFTLIRHGVPQSHKMRSSTSSSRCPRVLAVGRLVEKKGFIYLIRTCALLQKENIDFRCTIIGDGPDQKLLRKEIELFGLRNKIELVGAKNHSDTLDAMRNSDVLVAPSIVAANGDRDGLPNVILEAMTVGLPVVATDVGGIPEAIVDNATGLLCVPTSPESLSECIIRLLKNPKLFKSIVTRAHSFAQSDFPSADWLLILEGAIRKCWPNSNEQSLYENIST